MTVTLLQGDALEMLKTMPEGCVQTCVTSPPYYGLRDYGVEGQIGLEQTPEAYIEKLVAVFREVKRVLKDDGTLWCNIGDSYNGSGGPGSQYDSKSGRSFKGEFKKYANPNRDIENLKPKDLIGIPWMLAFALRADGWYLRQDIIWHKPNPMPESVTDRCTKAHEYIFLLAKSQRYFFDSAAISEPLAEATTSDGRYKRNGSSETPYGDSVGKAAGLGRGPRTNGTGTRNRRSVWTVTTKPYKEAHFATFPPDLIEPCILAGTSERGECPKCGKAWVRIVQKSGGTIGKGSWNDHAKDAEQGRAQRTGSRSDGSDDDGSYKVETLGWRASCDCGEEPVPQTVLDPFNGSGTTGAVSLQHGRNYIGIELNPAYLELTRKRLSEVQPMMVMP